MAGRAEGLACADPGARTPINASGNFTTLATVGVGGFFLLIVISNIAWGKIMEKKEDEEEDGDEEDGDEEDGAHTKSE